MEREQEALLRLGTHGLDCLPQLVASGTVAEPSALQVSLLAANKMARQLLLRIYEVLCTRQLAATRRGMTPHQPACAGPLTPILGCKLPGTIHLQGAPVVITALRGTPLYCRKTDELMQLSSEQLDLLAADGLEAICVLLVSSLNEVPALICDW